MENKLIFINFIWLKSYQIVKILLKNKQNLISIVLHEKKYLLKILLTTQIIEALINELEEKSRLEKLKNWFGEHITSIEVKETKINFKVDDELSRKFKDYFPDYICELYD